MSASEKLKALDAAMTESYNRTLAKAEPPYFSSREISDLRRALPQIVAVVEAHQALVSWAITADNQLDQEFGGTGPYIQADEITRAEAALAALEEALS